MARSAGDGGKRLLDAITADPESKLAKALRPIDAPMVKFPEHLKAKSKESAADQGDEDKDVGAALGTSLEGAQHQENDTEKELRELREENRLLKEKIITLKGKS
ncbi:MAG: hypothetical protein WCT37_04410 [Patescibacteria group bacterium]|jgi:hypothetical protein